MADGNFRAYRRDPVAPRSADLAARANADDPLAELARLIGQGEPSHNGHDRRTNSADAYDAPAQGSNAIDWASDHGDAEAEAPAQSYAEPEEADYAAPAEDHDYEPPRREPIVPPAPRFAPPRESPRGSAAAPSRYREPQLAEPRTEELPAFLPRRDVRQERDARQERDLRYEYDDPAPSAADEQAYASDGYEEEDAPPRRRGGLVIVAAVLGLVVVGTAGAFAYRAMFGASMLPSLPPIIRADDTPTKIVPPGKQNASVQADANGARSGERLVPREEQPVNIAPATNPAPRVVSTIPIFPDSNSAAPPNVVASGGANFPAAAAPAPAAVQAVPPPAASMAPSGSPAALPATGAPAPMAVPDAKKIHTVAIHPDQLGNLAEAAAPPPPAAQPMPVAPAPMPTAVRPLPVHAATPAPPRPAAPPPVPAANAPMSIVPDQGGAVQPAPPPRARTALAQPVPLTAAPESRPAESRPAPAPAAGGGYSVQVTSQKTEAEAQAEFRTLRAKFPNQLGNREPTVRKADLGTKGVYYRALVGPFASMDQAAAMCSELKAAGGNCIVQRN